MWRERREGKYDEIFVKSYQKYGYLIRRIFSLIRMIRC
jgi:hypothetical protein